MATPSSDKKAQKQPRGEVPVGPKNEVASAPGDAHRVSNPDPGASVPSVSSGLSPSGGGAPHSGTAGSSASALAAVGAISINGEGPGLPSTDRVQASERADLQGGRSPHAELRCVVPGAGQGLQASHTGGVGAVVQATRGVGQANGPPTLPTSLGKGRGRKQLGRKETAQVQKPPGRRCLFPRLLVPQCPVPSPPSSPGSQPSGRRRSRDSPWGQAAQPGPALRSRARAPGPALRSQAARPGLALNSHATPLGTAFSGHASGLVSALRSRTSAPGPSRRRGVPAPGPAHRPSASGSGPALQRRRTSAPGPAVPRRHMPASGPALRSRRRASAPGPALRSRRGASAPGPALRSRRGASAPGPALRSRRRASAPGPALRSHASAPGPAYRNGAAAPGPAYHNRASSRRASGPGPALNNHASPGPALRSRALGSGPDLRSRANRIAPALRNGCSTSGFVLRSRTIERSSPRSRASLPVPTSLSPPSSPGVALRRLVCQSSSSSPNPEVPSVDAQPRWHAVRMRASSPSPPGRLFPFPEQLCGESSSSSSSASSSRSPGQSPSSSSPKFSGLGSISTPSPASLRRALLPELDALSPLSPGEEAETGSMPSSPIPPVV
ncbi:EZH inhibitory protein [Lontra canadensis]|uniref:EZH inhibitory protein n=1 Tax=Lontra canadensis TaxID=76717 RepID=UPI0013F380CE|nr:EZH inhibitory protein [Lontra canadensis]